jgi:hypothetical protein
MLIATLTQEYPNVIVGTDCSATTASYHITATMT